MARPLFAADTAVPVSKSREEIDRLLRAWGARGVQWTDEWDTGRVVLRFVWTFDRHGAPLSLQARFGVTLTSEEEIREQAHTPASRKFSASRFEELMRKRGQREHRVLLLWLRAALNAVELGIVPAEVIFLPFLEGQDGRTVADTAVPHLERLTSGGASLLLGDGRAVR